MDMLVAAALVLLHRVDGGEVLINPDQITSVHARPGGASSNKHLAEQAHCALWLTDGKMVAVLEACPRVRQLLEGARR